MSNKVLIPQDIPQAGKDYLVRQGYDIVMGTGYDETTLAREITECDAVLAREENYSKAVLTAGRNVRVVARFGTEVDNIDLRTATEMGIQVTNTPIANTVSVAEHALSLILACAKRLIPLNNLCHAGCWQDCLRNTAHAIELSGKTLGIIGLGHVGQMVARKAVYGLDMNVVAYDAYLAPEDFPENIGWEESVGDVFAASDFIALHAPATPATRDMINREVLERVRPGAFLVNCARGELINEAALVAALRDGRLAGAALDVLCEEPPEQGHPLLHMENVILSPHSGSLTEAAMNRMGLHAAKGIDEVLQRRRPTWPVNQLVE